MILLSINKMTATKMPTKKNKKKRLGGLNRSPRIVCVTRKKRNKNELKKN
jgi:hypothetical protein